MFPLWFKMIFGFDNSFSRLPCAFYEPVEPGPVSNPLLVRVNDGLAETLGLNVEQLTGRDGVLVFSGNKVPRDSNPIAMAYSGHQFGGFSPRLGDGRAILLGEIVGRDGQRRDIQLKGAGPTPFSRRGDGRSALGPVLREYLVSEAMAALGVPTTRALAAVWSGDKVFREEMEPGGVFTRVARSHLRIGTFEYFASRRDFENLRILLDYTVERHFPEILDSGNRAQALLLEVVKRQASLIAQWMQFGFIHGVMNTDNMSISGETIDFGPCAFLDTYDPAKKFSYIDQQGRYAYGNQPMIAHWNLARLAEALLPLMATDEKGAINIAKETLEFFPGLFRESHLKCMTGKVGIPDGREEDWPIVDSLLSLLQDQEIDFTLSFRHLRKVPSGDESAFLSLFPRPTQVSKWLTEWREHLRIHGVDADSATATMRKSNPVFIPRNHRVEEVIAAGKQGDFEPFHRLHEILQLPFDEQPEFAEYEYPPKPHEVVRATFCGT
jgi:serine/tyrosine/threonine adenylyltransferase